MPVPTSARRGSRPGKAPSRRSKPKADKPTLTKLKSTKTKPDGAKSKSAKTKVPAKDKVGKTSKPASKKTVTSKDDKAPQTPVKAGAGTPRKATPVATPRKANATHGAETSGAADAGAPRRTAPVKTAATPSKATKRTTPPRPISLVLKVLGTINGELTKLEDHKGKSSQDRERASRALSQMVTSLEKTVDMQRQIQRDRSATSGPKDKEALRHAEEMRRDIAERLERLHRQRNAARGPEGSERG